jgi:hypothetical protein
VRNSASFADRRDATIVTPLRTTAAALTFEDAGYQDSFV